MMAAPRARRRREPFDSDAGPHWAGGTVPELLSAPALLQTQTNLNIVKMDFFPPAPTSRTLTGYCGSPAASPSVARGRRAARGWGGGSAAEQPLTRTGAGRGGGAAAPPPAAPRAPLGTHFKALHRVHVGVPEKDGPAAGLAHCVFDARRVQALNHRVDVLHVHAHVAVPANATPPRSAARDATAAQPRAWRPGGKGGRGGGGQLGGGRRTGHRARRARPWGLGLAAPSGALTAPRSSTRSREKAACRWGADRSFPSPGYPRRTPPSARGPPPGTPSAPPA